MKKTKHKNIAVIIIAFFVVVIISYFYIASFSPHIKYNKQRVIDNIDTCNLIADTCLDIYNELDDNNGKIVSMSLNEYNENLHCTKYDPTEHNEYKLTEKQISAFNDLINKSVFYVDHLYCKDIVVNGEYVTFRNDKGRACFVYSVSGIQPDFCNTPASEDKNIYVEKIAENWYYVCKQS